MRALLASCFASVLIASALLWAGPLPTLDQTLQLQNTIDNLPSNGILDCAGRQYSVTSLQLKSNMTIQNCQLQTLPGTLDLVSPITIDGRTQAKSNIFIYNVHVIGNRHSQTNIGYVNQESGGRHCFRLLGWLSNIVIDQSSGDYCASDGIALVSYGVASSDSPDQLPFQNITIRNSDFSFNKRHGASADGVRNLTFENVTFFQNGTTIPGDSEGDLCAFDGAGRCYGSGFWYEDYRPTVSGEGLNGLVISSCVFRQNYQRSIFFNTLGSQSSPGYQPRSHVRITGSYLDDGASPTQEDYALQFQVNDAIVAGGAAFLDVVIQNSILDGSVGFRQTSTVLVESSQIQTSLPYLGYAAYSTGFTFLDLHAYGKALAAQYDPSGQGMPAITYSMTQSNQSYASGPPQSGTNSQGDIVWNSQPGANPTGWVCVVGGTPCSAWSSF